MVWGRRVTEREERQGQEGRKGEKMQCGNSVCNESKGKGRCSAEQQTGE